MKFLPVIIHGRFSLQVGLSGDGGFSQVVELGEVGDCETL
jgi:hypothetical protein